MYNDFEEHLFNPEVIQEGVFGAIKNKIKSGASFLNRNKGKILGAGLAAGAGYAAYKNRDNIKDRYNKFRGNNGDGAQDANKPQSQEDRLKALQDKVEKMGQNQQS